MLLALLLLCSAPVQSCRAQPPLEERLLLRLDVPPGDKERLRAIVSDMLRSRLCRRLSKEFLALGGKARVRFEALEGTRAVWDLDHTAVLGHQAMITLQGDDQLIVLNEGFFRRPSSAPAATLAHELLGHALARQSARRSSYGDLLDYSADNEAYASLVSFVAGEELGEPDDNASIDVLLTQGPEAFAQAIRFEAPSYALALSPEELPDAGRTLRSRLAGLEFLMRQHREKASYGPTWLGWARHFTEVHGLDPKSFLAIKGSVYAYREVYKAALPNEESARELLRAAIALDEPPGRGLSARLEPAARDPFFRGMHARVLALLETARRLKASRPRRPEDRMSPRGPGQWNPALYFGVRQLSFDELRAMQARDAELHPDHWQK